MHQRLRPRRTGRHDARRRGRRFPIPAPRIGVVDSARIAQVPIAITQRGSGIWVVKPPHDGREFRVTCRR